MPERIPQSTTIRVPLQAFLSSDHVSPATGKTIAITISKNGAAYGNPSGGVTNATEIASGSFYVDLSVTDSDTIGPLFVLGTSSGVDNVVAIYNVVKGTVDANIVSILDHAALATQQGLLDVRLAEVDGTTAPVHHGGTQGSGVATLALQSVNVTCPEGDAFQIVATDGTGWSVTSGTGYASTFSAGGGASAIRLTGGENGGHGLLAIGGDNGGTGSKFLSSTGPAFYLSGSSSNPTFLIESGDGEGVRILTGDNHGINVLANGTNKKALLLGGDAATDSFAITVSFGSPSNVFDAAGRVTGSATLLDATPITDSGGADDTFPKMLVSLWRSVFRKSSKAVSDHTIKTYADDNTTVRTSQTWSDDGAGNQSKGPAT